MKKICAIVVLYNPDSRVKDNLSAIISQADETIIVDNGSKNDELKEIIDLYAQLPRVKFILLEHNLGIATALNMGVRESMKTPCTWIATFDQDSRIGADYFSGLLAAYDFSLDRDKVMMIAPRYYNSSSKRLTSSDGVKAHKIKSENSIYRYIDFTITSGNLVKKVLFMKIGLFTDKLFIDQVDHDICLRCRNAGYSILESINVVLTHELGAQTQHKILHLEPIATNHSALRRYYMARNRVYMYKHYYMSNRGWVVTDIVRFFKDMIVIALFESGRQEKLAMSSKGIYHGLFGKYGKYEEIRAKA